MATLKESNKKKYYELITGIWLLTKEYGEPENSDDYWNAVVKDVDDFARKFEGDALATKLLYAWLDGINDELVKRNKAK